MACPGRTAPITCSSARSGTTGRSRAPTSTSGALLLIVSKIGRRVKVIMTAWGGQVEDSRALADARRRHLIAWVPPLNRVQLVRHLKSVDIVFDQIALPCFGGTAPQAIASKVPVIMSYRPCVHGVADP